MKDGSEIITIKITTEAFTELYNEGLIGISGEDWELKEVAIQNEEYPNNKHWKDLKDASIKAFKLLKEYEFKLRHNL